jgi:hypothetical protein
MFSPFRLIKGQKIISKWFHCVKFISCVMFLLVADTIASQQWEVRDCLSLFVLSLR